MGDSGRTFYPLIHNTVSPTILHGSTKVNVIPGEVSVELDGRLLPGFKPEDMLAELRPIVGNDVELEVLRYDPGPSEPNMGLFNTLSDILRKRKEHDPALLSGLTDGNSTHDRHSNAKFCRCPCSERFPASQTIHAENERVPAAIAFGADAIYQHCRD
jgi:acetylornithine deacetylase/succinyl-diaminopimelate desuccinylase-like protein